MIIVFEYMADSYYQLWACEMVSKDILIMLQTFSVTLYSWLGVTSFISQKRASLGAEQCTWSLPQTNILSSWSPSLERSVMLDFSLPLISRLVRRYWFYFQNIFTLASTHNAPVITTVQQSTKSEDLDLIQAPPPNSWVTLINPLN